MRSSYTLLSIVAVPLALAFLPASGPMQPAARIAGAHAVAAGLPEADAGLVAAARPAPKGDLARPVSGSVRSLTLGTLIGADTLVLERRAVQQIAAR